MTMEFPQNLIFLELASIFITVILIRFKLIKGKGIIAAFVGSLSAILGFSLIYKQFDLFGRSTVFTFELAAQEGHSQWLLPSHTINALLGREQSYWITDTLFSYLLPLLFYFIAAIIFTIGFKKHRRIVTMVISALCHGALILLYPLLQNLLSGGIVFYIDIFRGICAALFFLAGALLPLPFLRLISGGKSKKADPKVQDKPAQTESRQEAKSEPAQTVIPQRLRRDHKIGVRKYLFLLGSVFREWFTSQRKFTACIMVMFTMTSFVMSFAVTVVGGDILYSEEQFDRQRGSYTIDYGNGRTDYSADSYTANSYIENAVNTAEELFGLGDLRVSGFFSGINGNEYTEARVLPRYEDTEKYRYYLQSSLFITAGVLDSYFNIFDSLDITEGRRITDEDCKNGGFVLVLPEEYGLKLGEHVDFCGTFFEIVGLTASMHAEIPAPALQAAINKYNSENEDGERLCSYTTFMGFIRPLTKEQVQAIETGIFEDTGVKLTLIEGVTDDGGTTGAFVMVELIFGGIIGLFSMLCIYNVAVRLCKSMLPMMNILKLCGLKGKKAAMLLVCALLICLSACFGLAWAVTAFTEPFFASFIGDYSVRGFAVLVSAAVMIIAALAAMLPPVLSVTGDRVNMGEIGA